jgi:hypothetical protein
MQGEISSFSYSVRQRLRHAQVSITLGHVHQAVAAVFGYRSYAAYMASQDEPHHLRSVRHLIAASDLFAERMRHLGQDPAQVAPAIADELRQRYPQLALHESVEEFAQSIENNVEGIIANSEEFSAAMAETNTAGLPWFSLEYEPEVPIDTAKDQFVLTASGSASLEQDEDRPFSGDELDVSARIVSEKLGRRLLADYRIQDISADVADY